MTDKKEILEFIDLMRLGNKVCEPEAADAALAVERLDIERDRWRQLYEIECEVSHLLRRQRDELREMIQRKAMGQ